VLTEPAKRVRVVLADAIRAQRASGPDRAAELPRVEPSRTEPLRPEPVRPELAEDAGIGETLVTGLVRAQLALALRCAVLVVVGLGGLPLLFAAAPSLAATRPFGVALPWLLLGVAAYPFLFGVGWAYVHLAERTERDFTDLVEKR
jgi:hypothetical protein